MKRIKIWNLEPPEYAVLTWDVEAANFRGSGKRVRLSAFTLTVHIKH